MKFEEDLRRVKMCPRFDACSAPKCPLDSLIKERIQLKGELTCPYTIRIKKRRIRPIPKRVRQFLIPVEDGGYKSIFQKGRRSDL